MVQGAELEGVNLESRSTSVPLCTVKLRLRTGLPRSNLLFSQLHTLQGRSCLYLFFALYLQQLQVYLSSQVQEAVGVCSW